MEWMYGWDKGDANGSPAAVMGNLRDSEEARERRNTGMVAGYISIKFNTQSIGVQTCLVWVQHKGLDVALTSLLKDLNGFWS
jgi:hypothetical protein